MLILTRRVGETLMIGDEVTVTVLGVKGNQVRIGINAPKDVAVHREEIYERIRQEQTGDAAEGISGIEIHAMTFHGAFALERAVNQNGKSRSHEDGRRCDHQE